MADGHRLKLTPNDRLIVVEASPEELVVEALYAPNGSPPPAHLHPAQEEHFEVLAGHMETVVDGEAGRLDPGTDLVIPAGVVHQMWNSGAEEARVAWKTSPGGRTLEWFERLDALWRDAETRPNGMPDPEAFGPLLGEYADTFQLAPPPNG